MPFTFIEIEERSSKSIALLFSFLVGFYFFGFLVLASALKLVFLPLAWSGGFLLTLRPAPKELLVILLTALFVALLHWLYSVFGMADRLLHALKAEPPDQEDSYHGIFRNIVQEVGVAAGGKSFEAVVLPSVAMNAFSISDFRKRRIIGITEGLLSRLNRNQLEAVVAHEAAHLATGDTLLKTVSVSLFGVYAAMLEAIRKGGKTSGDYRPGGIVHPYIGLIYLLTLLLYGVAKLISMFISRECEYRADAVAVRLTRNPLTLAQALYAISQQWRGGGLGYEYMEGIFIFNPDFSRLDEKDGFWANIFSTHPPLWKRLDMLLDMAHADIREMAAATVQEARLPPGTTTRMKAAEPRWYAVKDGAWSGPFSCQELFGLSWFNHYSFVRREGEEKISLVYQDPLLIEALRNKDASGSPGFTGGPRCPRCFKPLEKVPYEGTSVLSCGSCGGILLEDQKLPRIIVRQKQGFSAEVLRDAAIMEKTLNKYIMPGRPRGEVNLACPRCLMPMLNNFYSLAYPIQVDRCLACKSVWFDSNELELLQCLIEKALERQPPAA